jgi:signal transduction histidine kinase
MNWVLKWQSLSGLIVKSGKKYNIETEFQDDGEFKPLDDDIRAILFSNIRELLFNVVKHANAQKVEVSVSKDDEDIMHYCEK